MRVDLVKLPKNRSGIGGAVDEAVKVNERLARRNRGGIGRGESFKDRERGGTALQGHLDLAEKHPPLGPGRVAGLDPTDRVAEVVEAIFPRSQGREGQEGLAILGVGFKPGFQASGNARAVAASHRRLDRFPGWERLGRVGLTGSQRCELEGHARERQEGN